MEFGPAISNIQSTGAEFLLKEISGKIMLDVYCTKKTVI